MLGEGARLHGTGGWGKTLQNGYSVKDRLADIRDFFRSFGPGGVGIVQESGAFLDPDGGGPGGGGATAAMVAEAVACLDGWSDCGGGSCGVGVGVGDAADTADAAA